MAMLGYHFPEGDRKSPADESDEVFQDLLVAAGSPPKNLNSRKPTRLSATYTTILKTGKRNCRTTSATPKEEELEPPAPQLEGVKGGF